MHQYRVTKYDPAKRSSTGKYLDQEEWTCCSEIGNTKRDSPLTLQEYLFTETLYVNAVSGFFAKSGLPHLRVTRVAPVNTCEAIGDIDPALYDPSWSTAIYEDQRVGSSEISQLVRQNLRGLLGCSLEFHGAFFVHFGWDYYMYVGCLDAADINAAEPVADGLFVEECISPYGRPAGFNEPAKILVSDKVRDQIAYGDELIPIVGSEIEVENTHWRQLRRLFGYSSEHPFFGFFDIDQSIANKMMAELGISLNLERCDYTLDTTGS